MIKIKEITVKNIIAYIQGNIRYFLYYKPKLKWLIPLHIREQIEYRINSMDIECFNNGSCKLCGCRTTHLQMANKACDKPCYPKMFNKSIWNEIKEMEEGTVFEGCDFIWCVDTKTKNFKLKK